MENLGLGLIWLISELLQLRTIQADRSLLYRTYNRWQALSGVHQADHKTTGPDRAEDRTFLLDRFLNRFKVLNVWPPVWPTNYCLQTKPFCKLVS